MDYDNFTSGFARFMQKLNLVIAELIVYRLNFRIHRFAVHDVEPDDVRYSLSPYELSPPGSVIVLSPYRMPLSRQYPERILS
jgi:hypothetical protein